jgi:O-antigen/teichoic acid export membrane protein
MSVIGRLASGSIATWTQMVVTMAVQIALVPLYLSHWDKETYGVWLMIQAAIGLTRLFDAGHQTLLGNEFLRLGNHDRSLTRKIFYSSLPIAASLGLLELVFVGGIVLTGSHLWLFGLSPAQDQDLLEQGGLVLIIEAAVWLAAGCCGGIAVRMLSSFGYYTRMTWWGVAAASVTSTMPAGAVVLGSNLLGAGIVSGLATCFYCLPQFCDLWRIMKHEGLHPLRPDYKLGLHNLVRSYVVTAKQFLDMVRLQGVRLILGPVVGVSEMAAFATMRTGAHFALQGVGTVTGPLMPELMHFLRLKDQERTEAALGFVWLLVLAAMCPAVILLQWFAPMLFELWTRGKLPYDPALFGLLSYGVLIYALCQPAAAVVQGNNILFRQLMISLITGITVLGCLPILVSSLGIRGAGITLLVAEALSLVGYTLVAASWMKSHAMRWPARPFRTAALAVTMAGTAVGGMIIHPQAAKSIAVVGVSAECGLLVIYWLQLPQLARRRVYEIMNASHVTHRHGRHGCSAFSKQSQ